MLTENGGDPTGSAPTGDPATGADPTMTPDPSQTTPADGGQTGGEGNQATPRSVDVMKWLDEDQTLDVGLKEEIRKGYLRQSDYTKKTQNVAAVERAAKEFEKYRPYLEKVAKDPALSKLVFGEPSSPAQGEEEIPDDPTEFARWVKEKAVNEIRQENARMRDIEAAEKVDPRLASDMEYAQVIAGLVAQDPDFMAGRKSAVEATKSAIDHHKAYEEKLRKSVLEEMKSKAGKQTMVTPSRPGSPGSASSGKVAQTMAEAAAMAEEEMTSAS